MRRGEKGIITCAVTGSIHIPTITSEARLARSTQGDAALFDTDGDELAERLYYEYRTRVEVLAPKGAVPRANALDIETMTMTAVQARRDQELFDWTPTPAYRRTNMSTDAWWLTGPGRSDGPGTLPLHRHYMCKFGAPFDELWYLRELASWLEQHARLRFLLTASPLRLPASVSSPVTVAATVSRCRPM